MQHDHRLLVFGCLLQDGEARTVAGFDVEFLLVFGFGLLLRPGRFDVESECLDEFGVVVFLQVLDVIVLDDPLQHPELALSQILLLLGLLDLPSQITHELINILFIIDVILFGFVLKR